MLLLNSSKLSQLASHVVIAQMARSHQRTEEAVLIKSQSAHAFSSTTQQIILAMSVKLER